MRAGSPVRNALLAVTYLSILPVAIAFLPATLALVVGFNVCGAADRLDALPGVGKGGVVAAAVGAAFGFALLAALDVVLPDGGETTQREIAGAAVFESPEISSSEGDAATGTESGLETRA
ncbi:hypothetical protein C474_06195 [Halogeometricum pallidum JCM 14848]|uniref:Uncharacterized protein n=2 Tax=Halogeometricum TaxID=60846 RepID=M0DBK1_HALPD|nr:hypothetical protein C474_06195 [Halogeometricum pallidum JCM 14848]